MFQKTTQQDIASFIYNSDFFHDDVIKWKHFPRNCPFVRGIHRSRWIPHTKASDAELWINGWVNNREAGDLRSHRGHHDVNVIVMYMGTYQWRNRYRHTDTETKGWQIRNTSSSTNIGDFLLKFHRILFLRAQSIKISIGPYNGLVPDRRQGFINDCLICWRIYASLSYNELTGLYCSSGIWYFTLM